MNIRIISMIILLLALIFSGCTEKEQPQTPVKTATSTPEITTAPPTVIPTTKITPAPTSERKKGLIISDVDEYGFNKLTLVNATGTYENHTIAINRSDTVKWVSVTTAGYYLTIVSKEGLWNNSSGFLKYSLVSSFSYTFNEPGTYEVYLKEFPRLPHQKIIVRP